MNKSPVYDHILLDDHSATPKYQQLVKLHRQCDPGWQNKEG
jgi:hypothetical protein